MNNLYKFSPINTETDFDKVLEYLVVELERLSLELIGAKLPINTLKIFAHYPDEYQYLYQFVSNLGPAAPFNSPTSYYTEFSKKIQNYDIKYIGVRIVDPYRLHVGCGDYEVSDIAEAKQKYLGNSEYVRSLREDMIELWHPDFDVLGYIVS